MEQEKKASKRFVQKRGKSVYVNMPPEETGLYEGDIIEIQVLSKGNVLLRKLEHIDIIKDESTINRILNIFGIHTDMSYKSVDGEEIIKSKTSQ